MTVFLIVTSVIAVFVLAPFAVVAFGYQGKMQAVEEQIRKAPFPESLDLYYDKAWLLPMSILFLAPFLALIVGHCAILLQSDTQLYQLFLMPLTLLASLIALPTFKALANINRARISLSTEGIAFLDRDVGAIVKVPWTDVLELQPLSFRANNWLRIKFTRDEQERQVDLGEGFTKQTFEFNCWAERFWTTYRAQG